MRCSVPFCRNSTDNVSVLEGKGAVTFYGFPSEVHLRAAWLRALSHQDVDLQSGAVVCSQHFLDDEMYKTDSGLVQILPGAIPSTIQACMICLDTDRKLVLMSKYKLEEVYEKLTGHPLFVPGNLKRTVCILCAQRLRNFKTFRAKSLRARSLMMDLVEKYVLVTNEHVRKINSVKNHLQYNFVQKTLGTDHCDFYIVEPDETKHIKTEEAHDEIVVVKNEKDDECNEKPYIYTNNADDSFVLSSEDLISDGNTLLDVKNIKTEEAHNETVIVKTEKDDDECNEKTYKYTNNAGDGFVLSSEDLISDGNTLLDAKNIKTEEAHNETVIVKTEKDDDECNEKTYIYTNNADDSFVLSSEDLISDGNTLLDIKQLDLCNGLPSSLTASTLDCASQFTIKHESDHLSEEYNQYNMNMHQQQNGDVSGNGTAHVWEADVTASSSTDSIHAAENKHNIEKPTDHASPDFTNTFVTTIDADTTQKKIASDNQPTDSNTESDQNVKESSHCVVKVCDIFTNTLTVPKREETRNANNICDSHDIDISKELIYRPSKSEISATQSKPEKLEVTQKSLECSNEGIINFECEVNSVMNSSSDNRLLIEKKKKQFTCNICSNTYNRKSTLAKHIKQIHAESKQLKTKAALLKILTCKICQYETRHKYHFTVHMRIHTGEKPYSCELCKYKCVSNSRLVVHMRTHTGEKPFKCKLCEYRSVKKSDLVQHMRTHTGEKPYTCELCKHRFSRTSSLAKHRKTHTGEKPHSCDTCDYKCARSSDLVRHMRIHTGEKPYSCALCKDSFSYNSGLAKHMKTHVGEMP